MRENLNAWSIYPLEGNHDFGTINSQDFSNPTPDPMITFNAEQWQQWMTPDAHEQFKVNGFYSERLKTSSGEEFSNTRVIAVNTEACYAANFYLMKLRNDPGGILQWLEDTLYEMEANGETAILLGHVPPGDSCLYQWATRFTALMDRFQAVVRLQIFGHVHKEMHNTLRSPTSDKPIAVNFWTGSMTTYSEQYPSFRRFVMDKQTMLPIAIETYKLDVEAENPDFVLDHELKEFYGMPNLAPSSFGNLSDQFKDDETQALKYINTKS